MSLHLREHRVGDHVRGTIHDPQHGTTSTVGIITAVTELMHGNRRIHATMSGPNGTPTPKTYLVNKHWHSDQLRCPWPIETLSHLRRTPFYPRDVHVPPLGSTEPLDTDAKLVAATYRLGTAVWHIAEADPATGDAFGWAEVAPGFGEWGHIDLPELEGLRIDTPEGIAVVRRERVTTPTSFASVIH